MKNNTQNQGIGMSGVLFTVFLMLKLTGVIAWSWWWITAPLWVPLAIVLGIILAVFILSNLAEGENDDY